MGGECRKIFFVIFVPMLAITKHIEYLLTEHDCVLIPGLGGFVMQDLPARFVPDGNMFYPPSRSIVFNPTLTYNDGLLAASLMRARQIGYEQASQFIDREIDTLRALLKREGDRVTFGNIGVFVLTEDNTLSFEASPDYLLNLNYFGLPTVTLLPEKEVTGSGSERRKRISSRADSGERVIHFSIRRRVLNRAMVVVAAVIVLFLISIPLANRPEVDQAALTFTTITDDVNNRVAEGEYLIVVSTLTSRENAWLQLQKFHNEGVADPIFLYEDGRRTYLYTRSFSDRREAYTFLKKQQNEKNEIFPGAWVMKVKDSSK